MIPRYKEELEYKLKNNTLPDFDDNDIAPIINIHRKNYGIENKPEQDINKNRYCSLPAIPVIF